MVGAQVRTRLCVVLDGQLALKSVNLLRLPSGRAQLAPSPIARGAWPGHWYRR
jgi:hypothetical protein